MTTAVPAAAIAELAAKHRGELLAYARRRIGSQTDAEDLVHHVLARALSNAEQLSDVHRGRAWLFRILRNAISDRSGREIPVDVEELDRNLAPDAEMDSFACSCVLSQLDALPPSNAAILRRVVLEGVTLSEAAEELAITTNNATVRLHRARRALRERLREQCGTDSLRACLSCAC